MARGGLSGGVKRRPDDGEFQRRVEDARGSVSLSDLIGRVTSLKRRGNRELVGLCPFHNERSPSFEVNDDKGTYHCWGCGEAGDVFTFLTKHHGMTFVDALRDLEGGTYPEVTPEQRAQRKQAAEREMGDRIAVAREIWSRSIPAAGTPAEVYARSRGITMPLPKTVRFVMTPRWRDPESGEVGRDYPAMACALQDVTGKLVGVQCVFLADGGLRKYARFGPDGKKAKAKLSYGQVVGSAFRAGGPFESEGTEIIVCEGPEDGLTLAQEFPGRNIWVTCGTALMPRIIFPQEIRTIVLAGDNNEAGRTAIREATVAFLDRGLSVRQMWPEAGFKDWNDQLRGIRA